MNFTREPIIETVITPREGCKLVVRSSKGTSQEDYFVDAVEVVSFGHSFFFRSLERPKAFLVPVSDYEILELKETRMVLKNASSERSIKIGGGREAPPPSRPAPAPRESEESSSEPRSSDGRKQGRRRRGRRGGRDRGQEPPFPHREEALAEPPAREELPSETSSTAEETKAPSFISKLFPPPPTLIKESLSRYKPAESSPEDLFPRFDAQKTSFEEELLDLSEEQPPKEMPDEIEEE